MTEGLRRASRAPGLIVTLWAINLLVATPLAVLLFESIDEFTAESGYHQALLEGLDTGWYAEFSTSNGSLGETFSPGHVGVGAWLTNLDRWWNGKVFLEAPALLAAGAVFVVLWIAILGGLLEALREGAPRPRLSGVLADGASFFPRFARIALIMAAAYYGLFRFAYWLFPRIHDWTSDLTSERQVLLCNLAAAGVIVLLLAALRMVSDYAKIATVVERRRSAVSAVSRGVRFVLGEPLGALGIAAGYGLITVLVFLLYAAIAPDSRDATPFAILLAFGISQAGLVVKLVVRVAFLGSQVSFFEVRR